MLCPVSRVAVPVAGANVAAIAVQVAQARKAGAEVAELRLDLCAQAGAELRQIVDAIKDLELPILATNRHGGEGGAWRGSENDRLRWLLEADAKGAHLIDVEHARIGDLPRRPSQAGLVLSYHDYDGMGENLDGRLRAMYAAGATIAKVAVMPSDAAELAELADLAIAWGRHGEQGKAVIVLGMGEYGLPSRLLAGAWGCDLTFGRLPDSPGSAPGQPTVQELVERYRVGQQGPETRIFGVLGDPIGHSLSPVIHNLALQHHGIDGVYVPFRASDALGFWRGCGDWIDGLSITIPHKTALLTEVDEMEELAHRIGAINTIYRDRKDPRRTIGANTDAPAAVECVEQCLGTLSGRRVLLLGAGGVGRAIAFAMHAAGGEVFIANRHHEKAEALAAEVGCQATHLEAATELSYDVLVNGTSVGMNEDATPWLAARHRPKSLVFDTVYRPLETRLLREAAAANCQPVCGLSMLIKQALGQFRRWTGLDAPEPLMQRAALEALGIDWDEELAEA